MEKKEKGNIDIECLLLNYELPLIKTITNHSSYFLKRFENWRESVAGRDESRQRAVGISKEIENPKPPGPQGIYPFSPKSVLLRPRVEHSRACRRRLCRLQDQLLSTAILVPSIRTASPVSSYTWSFNVHKHILLPACLPACLPVHLSARAYLPILRLVANHIPCTCAIPSRAHAVCGVAECGAACF
ncbi:hypothetical protein BCR34DRAFT_389274 [Clohesyomyces aquaticus]|uniref:Uncharacterized protein n=1 Tax=Clohesyomyces aquaticus TaxID=1231657 RepID=A0A1Y1ZFF0_9PLEO|nr:hypothetical protein BCR34DRAFT_389274 [Clohesyomyces aquaticus]